MYKYNYVVNYSRILIIKNVVIQMTDYMNTEVSNN